MTLEVSAIEPPLREVEASVAQRLLWLLEHYRGRGGALNVPMIWRIRGALEVDALQQALDALVARHEALRSTYRAAGRRLVCAIHGPAALPIELVDVADAADPELTASVEMREDAARGLDPARWPTRARLWRIGADDYLFLLNIHQLASDASSHRLLSRDMKLLYDGAVGLEVELPDILWQYADWAVWQRQALSGDGLGRLKRYWANQLLGAEPVCLPMLATPAARPEAARPEAARPEAARPEATRPEAARPEAARPGQERCDIEPELVQGLRKVAERNDTTLFAVAIAAFYTHLYRLDGQRDLSVASPFPNRTRPEVTETVGFFVNMLVLRLELDSEADFDTVVHDADAAVAGATAHIDLPYQMLPPGMIRPPTGPGERRIDDVVFHVIDEFGDERTRSGLEIDGVLLPLDQTRFALELVFVVNDNEECFISLRFDERRLRSTWARRFLTEYVELSRALVARPEVSLADVLVRPRANGVVASEAT